MYNTCKSTHLGRLIVNNKDTMKKLGVYKMYRKDCKAVYIGGSGRNIETRTKEHKR